MRINKTLAGLSGVLLLAAGTALGADDSTRSDDKGSTTVVVSMPGGRRVVQTSEPDSTTRVLPDGSRVSYGNSGSSTKAVKRRAVKAAAKSKSGSASKSSAATGRTGASSSSSSSSGSSGGRTTQQTSQPVSTIGTPRYSDDSATGGQDVRFFDAGISAMVVGRTVFIWGADLVQSDQPFELVEGERFAFDGAVITQSRPDQTAGQALSGADQLFAPLKLEYASNTTVTLTLQSQAQNPETPDRTTRTWTFRVR